jgi:hypothetical protein
LLKTCLKCAAKNLYSPLTYTHNASRQQCDCVRFARTRTYGQRRLMLSGDKRASLSSNLLDGKDAIPVESAVNEPQQATNGVSKSDAKLRDTVLYNKGAASASGFRPRHWSYDAQPADHAATVTPFPASASAPRTTSAREAAPTASRGRLAMVGLGAFSTLALIASASLYVLSRPHDGGAPASAPLAAASATPASATIATAPQAPAPVAPTAVAVATAQPSLAPASTTATSETVALAEPQPDPPPRVETSPVVEPPAEERPSAAVPPSPPAPAEIQELVSRGTQLLATGDIAAARVFFERAAEQGSAAAATAAGKTYDPLYLEETHVRGIRGDPVAAAKWYRRASANGDKEADLRMRKLIARYAG